MGSPCRLLLAAILGGHFHLRCPSDFRPVHVGSGADLKLQIGITVRIGDCLLEFSVKRFIPRKGPGVYFLFLVLGILISQTVRLVIGCVDLECYIISRYGFGKLSGKPQ